MTSNGIAEKILSLLIFNNSSINALLLVCLTYFVAGYVFVRQINIKDYHLSQFRILLSPLFGFSFLALFLNTSVIFGAQMKYLYIFVLLELLISLILMLYDHFKFINFRSVVILIVAMAVLLFSSIGLFNIGKNYLGYGWVDSLNYISAAEILKHYPLNIPRSSIMDKPYLIPGFDAKNDRIAECLNLVFFSILFRENTKFVFGPVILSSVFLFFLASFLLTQLFIKSWIKSIFVAVNIGISSSFAMLHIETFLSHALAVPFLIVYLYLIELFKSNISKYNLFCLAIIFSTLFFLYPELVPVLIIISIPYIFIFFNKRHLFSASVFMLMILFFFLVNKSVVLNIIFNRVGVKLSVLDPIYSFSGSIFMLNRIMFGHIDTWEILTVVSILVVSLSMLNLFFIFKNKEKNKYGMSVAILLLVIFFPLVYSYKYHYFKLFLTISPLIILSFYVFLNRFTGKGKIFNMIFIFILLFCLFFSVKGTRNIIRFTYLPGGRSQIGGLYYAEDATLNDSLEKLSEKKILINGRNSMETAWLAYHARRNTVKVIGSDYAMRDISASYPSLIFNSKDKLGDYQIISTQKYPEVIEGKDLSVFSYFSNSQGLEGNYPDQFSWIGKKAEFGFYLNKNQSLNGNLSIEMGKGPFNDLLIRKFQIYSGKNLLGEGNFNDQSKMFYYPVTLNKGENNFDIITNMSHPIHSNSTDPREFNILASNMKLFLCDGSFKNLYYLIHESDGWVTDKGMQIIGCMPKGADELRIHFDKIVKLDDTYNFQVNSMPIIGIRKGNSVIIHGILQFIKDNYLSVEIIPEFYEKLGKDQRDLSFFPVNYSRF